MNESNSLDIRQTTDEALFDRLAVMMAASDPWMTLGMDAPACRAGFNGPCKEVFVGFRNEEPAALAILQVCGSFDGYIQVLFVPAAFQGRGFGTRMLGYCEERIYRRSPNVFLCVSTFNVRAFQLYTSAGYQVVGVLKDFVKKGSDEWLLRKSMGARLGHSV